MVLKKWYKYKELALFRVKRKTVKWKINICNTIKKIGDLVEDTTSRVSNPSGTLLNLS